MGHPSEEQLDAFAKGVAEGRIVRQAAISAGYSGKATSYYRRCKTPDFLARVERFRRERDLASNPNLVSIIERLIAAADGANEAANGALLRAQCALLAEAARLKQLLAARASEADDPGDYDLPNEEWEKICGRGRPA
ncbi:MAG: hypothetical protein ACREEB_06780 [Caulobacteraceae bacterium]